MNRRAGPSGARVPRPPLPAVPAAAAQAWPGRAPPLLGRRRLAAPRRARGGTPGTPLLDLHRRLPPPPLPPPFSRRLHGAAGRRHRKCAPFPARAPPPGRTSGAHPALPRVASAPAQGRHGDKRRGRHDPAAGLAAAVQPAGARQPPHGEALPGGERRPAGRGSRRPPAPTALCSLRRPSR